MVRHSGKCESEAVADMAASSHDAECATRFLHHVIKPAVEEWPDGFLDLRPLQARQRPERIAEADVFLVLPKIVEHQSEQLLLHIFCDLRLRALGNVARSDEARDDIISHVLPEWSSLRAGKGEVAHECPLFDSEQCSGRKCGATR